MKNYRYLIVGGGLTADAAARGIRELDTEGSIGILSMEPDPPYLRPNLSKGLWKGRPLEKIWRNTQSLNVDLILERKVTLLDPLKKYVRAEMGDEYSYDKLLLATGGSPAHLPFGADNIIYYRNLQDYRRLRALTDQAENFLVIGGGFIGSEIAAALSMNGKKVVMVFPEENIGAKIYPKDLADFITAYYRKKGVEIVAGDSIADIVKNGDRLMARTKGARTFDAAGVVAGIGIKPNLELAQRAGLRVGDGIIVDEHLKTSTPGIFSAGDAANFFHSALEKRVRVEHEDNALKMGKQAGRNMAGADESYTHVPMFYSDLFELGYEAVGELNSGLETVSDWQDSFNKGVIYYLDKGRVRGVLLWNVWKRVDQARTLMAEVGPFKPQDLIGRIKSD
jgi:NADPH-dependent 2,4-dienoyl-CoA reductase/sulfur reductase-like enzyme